VLARRLFCSLRKPIRLKDALARRLNPLRVIVARAGLIRRFPNLYISYVPDRFSEKYCEYIKLGNIAFKENLRKYLERNEERNAGDLTRYYFLTLACDQIIKDRVPGHLAELGVYKGNTAFLLAQTARRMQRITYLFDTFEGFSPSDLSGIDADKKMEFGDTSLESVKALVGETNVTFVKGHFPESVSVVAPQVSFCLVHIDCDLYAPCRAALEYFYPRLNPGGFLIMHDYSSMYWNGVAKAVDDFFADKVERLIPIPDKSGSVAVRKIQ